MQPPGPCPRPSTCSSRAIAASGRLLPRTWLSKENRMASQVGGFW
jgi:hypothetical protein